MLSLPIHIWEYCDGCSVGPDSQGTKNHDLAEVQKLLPQLLGPEALANQYSQSRSDLETG